MAVVTIDAAPPLKAKKGLFRTIREFFGGERLKEFKIEDHTKFALTIGRGIAPFILITFSLAFSVQLSGEAIARLWAALFEVGKFDIRDLINAVTTNLAIVAMDVSMIIAFIKVRDLMTRGKGFDAWWGYAAFGSAIALTEAGTFFAMLVSGEGANIPFYQFILDGVRSMLAPGSAIFLVVVPPHTMNGEEMEHFLLKKVVSALASTLESITITGQARFESLMSLFLHLSIKDAVDEKGQPISTEARMNKLQELLRDISPDVMRQEFERMMTELNGKLVEAELRVALMLKDALIGLAVNGAIPEHVIAVVPELEGLDFSRVAAPVTPAKVVRTAKVLSDGSSNDLRAVLTNLGVENFITTYVEKDAKIDPETRKKTTKKAHGVWLKSTDIRFLVEGKFDQKEAQAITIRCGDSAKSGVAYVAPAKAIMAELHKQKSLKSDLIRFVEFVDSSVENEENSSSDSANIEEE